MAGPARTTPAVGLLLICAALVTGCAKKDAGAERPVNIVARVSGFLEKIAYQEGKLVKEGQLLFQLDPKPLLAEENALSEADRLAPQPAHRGRRLDPSAR